MTVEASMSAPSPLAALLEVSGDLVASLDPEQVYATAHRVVARLMPAEVFIIALVEGAKDTVDFVYFFDKEERIYPGQRPAAGSLSARVAVNNEVVRIGDDWEQRIHAMHLGAPERVRSVLAVPLRLGGQAIGMLSIQTYQPAVYTVEHEQLLCAIANQVAIAIDHARLITHLRESEERYRRIVEIAQEGIWVVGADNHTTYVNQRLADMLGYTPEAMLGQSPRHYMDEAGWQQAEQFMARWHPGFVGEGDFQFVHRTGRIIWAILAVKVLHDPAGNYLGAHAMVTDITERKRQEAELERQKQLLERLVQMARATLSTAALDDTIHNLLGIAIEFTAAENGNLLLLDERGQVSHVFVRNATLTQPETLAFYQHVLEQGFAGWVLRHRQADIAHDRETDARWLHNPAMADAHNIRTALSVPIADARGALGVLNLAHAQPHHFTADHLRLMQAAADQLALAVRQAQAFEAQKRLAEQLQALIAASQEGVLLISVTRQVQVINQNALNFLHLPGKPARWLGRSAGVLLRLLRRQDNESLRWAQSAAQRIVRGDEPAEEGDVVVPPRHLHWANLPVRVGETILGRLIVLQDVTQARALDQMRSDLIHMMVHDLRSPLSSILSALEFIEPATTDPEVEKLLSLSHRNAERLMDLINAILDVSRLESGQMPLDYTPVAFAQLAQHALALQATVATQKHLQLAQQVPQPLPVVWADERLLARVLQNLVGNALKFTPPGGAVTLAATVVQSPQPALEVMVRDTGPGISPELRPRLFEKFVTGNLAGRGSGLGLAFCRLVIEAHGGKIWAESATEGPGTALHFTLPLKLPVALAT